MKLDDKATQILLRIFPNNTTGAILTDEQFNEIKSIERYKELLSRNDIFYGQHDVTLTNEVINFIAKNKKI